jgi:hypothetical protein
METSIPPDLVGKGTRRGKSYIIPLTTSTRLLRNCMTPLTMPGRPKNSKLSLPRRVGADEARGTTLGQLFGKRAREILFDGTGCVPCWLKFCLLPLYQQPGPERFYAVGFPQIWILRQETIFSRTLWLNPFLLSPAGRLLRSTKS